MYKKQEVLQGVLEAWSNPGRNPGYHEAEKARLKRSWPSLAYALEALADEIRPPTFTERVQRVIVEINMNS